MAKRTIQAISWQKARKILGNKKNLPNEEFLEIMDKLSESLKGSNKDYVYHLKLNFGDKVIDKGQIFLDEYEVIGNTYKKTLKDFNDEVLYSNDPLGIVLSNNIEVYTENRSKGDNGESYTFPLNNLSTGDLFGVFGTLDNFSPDKLNNTSRDWYARAGHVSFSIAFPFHNVLESNDINKGKTIRHLSSVKERKPESSPGNNKVEFIREYIDDWHVDIAYVPFHFFNDIPEQLKINAINKLYHIGWSQSAPLRNALFEDTTVFNLISGATSTLFKHDKLFLSILYNYLYSINTEETIVMKPLTGNHILTRALESFKKQNTLYFNSKKAREPLPFIFDKLKNCNDWGVVSVYHLPIIYNYSIRSLNDLLTDISDIEYLINNEELLKDMDIYKIPTLEGFGNTGGSRGVVVKKADELRDLFAKTFKLDKAKINLSSKEFSNLLLIKKKE